VEDLQFFSPRKFGEKTIVYPLADDVKEGVSKWRPSLVGQFFDKPLPFYLVKKDVTAMWKQYGEVEVFSLDNGLYIFSFSG
jgi:hypothetical protein